MDRDEAYAKLYKDATRHVAPAIRSFVRSNWRIVLDNQKLAIKTLEKVVGEAFYKAGGG